MEHNHSLILIPHSWDDRCVPPCLSLFRWDGISITFCPDGPQTAILTDSSSKVANYRCESLYCHGFLS
jgi:hypothetical protein